ncbi:MAG: hypothetical protein II174_10105 [Erysipelotrichaceae bacterium]|nr:hypothetical protein [Erysipelotrichaceae bacterium]
MKKITIISLILLGILCGCEKKVLEANKDEVINVKETLEKTNDEVITSHISEDKNERVYAKADAYGNIESIEVEVTLKSNGQEAIEDVSDLKDIRNTGEDEKFTNEDGKLVFENKGNDIHYKGIGEKKLPVSVTITYFLDGKEITAEDLKGKSGRLEMRFDYLNNTAREENGMRMIDPFMAMSILMLDEDVFSDVEIENGKLIQFGDVKAALIYSFPQIQNTLKLSDYKLTKDIELKDYGIIKANVRDFALDYTTTVLSNGIFKEIEDEDLKDVDSLIADSGDFDKDAKELTENTAKLYDATITLSDGIKTYTDGVATINNYLGEAIKGSKQLNGGIEGLKQLPQIQAILSVIPTEKSDLLTMIQATIDALDLTDEEKETKKKLFEDYLNAIDNDIASASIEESELAYLDESEQLLLQKYMSDVYFRTYLAGLSEGSSSLISGLEKIKQGGDTLVNNNSTINDGLSEMSNAAKEFDEGMNDFVNEDINDLMELSGAPLKNIVNRIRSLRKIDQEYGCYSGLLEGKSGKSTFLIETAAIK